MQQYQMRQYLAIALIVIAGLLTFPASMAFWEDRVIISESGFVSMGNKVFSRPEIQQELASILTKEISSLLGGSGGLGGLLGTGSGTNGLGGLFDSIFGTPAKPTTPGTKPATGGGALDSLIQPIALDVISSLPNSDLGDEALKQTHATVIGALKSKELRPEKDAIVLDLGPEVGSVLKEVQLVSTSKADASAGKIVLVDPTDLASVFRWARFLRGKVLILTALPLLAVAAAVAVADNRRAVLLYSGIALSVSSLLWILAAKGPIRPWVINRVAENDSDRRIAHTAYDVISASYVQQELIVMVIGIGIAVAGAVVIAKNRPPVEPPDPYATARMVRPGR